MKMFTKLLIGAAIVTVILTLAPNLAFGFDLPHSDPWYYQDNSRVLFWMPDKAQHYYGSQLLGKVMGPVAAISAGFIYEVYQSGEGIGFSPRDFAADVLGVLASQVNRGKVVTWLSYSTNQKTIIWNVSVKLG